MYIQASTTFVEADKAGGFAPVQRIYTSTTPAVAPHDEIWSRLRSASEDTMDRWPEQGRIYRSSTDGSIRSLAHTPSQASWDTESLRSTQPRFGSALLINASSNGPSIKTCASSAAGSSFVPRLAMTSIFNPDESIHNELSTSSTCFDSAAATPRSCRIAGRSPMFLPNESSVADTDWTDSAFHVSFDSRVRMPQTVEAENSAQDSENNEQSTEATRRSEQGRRLRRLLRWVGNRVNLGAAEIEAYARILEDNGFECRERLRELTTCTAEELGLPRRFASILRKEALLDLPANRKFGPLPPAPEIAEEDELPKPAECVEVCVMYDSGKREIFRPASDASTSGFPSQLRDYKPSSPRAAKQTCNRSASADRGGLSRENLAHRAHLKRQESGRKAQTREPDPWLASSFNHRPGRVAMPKARARSVAGFERPRGCKEMTGEIALTVPDKDLGWSSKSRDSDLPADNSTGGTAAEVSNQPESSWEGAAGGDGVKRVVSSPPPSSPRLVTLSPRQNVQNVSINEDNLYSVCRQVSANLTRMQQPLPTPLIPGSLRAGSQAGTVSIPIISAGAEQRDVRVQRFESSGLSLGSKSLTVSPRSAKPLAQTSLQSPMPLVQSYSSRTPQMAARPIGTLQTASGSPVATFSGRIIPQSGGLVSQPQSFAQYRPPSPPRPTVL